MDNDGSRAFDMKLSTSINQKHKPLLLAQWRVDPDERLISHFTEDVSHKVDSNTMEVLMLLIEKQGQIVSRDTFMQEVWSGKVTVEESLTRCVSELRKVFNDNPRAPKFIKTIPKKGYQLITEAVFENEPTSTTLPPMHRRLSPRMVVAVVCLLVLFTSTLFWYSADSGSNSSDTVDADVQTLLPKIDEMARIVTLPADATSSLTLYHNTNGRQYRISVSRNDSAGAGKHAATISVFDPAGFVVWQAAREIKSAAQKLVTAKDLAKVFELLAETKSDQAVASLALEPQVAYRRALYYLDKRGEDNVRKAIKILDNLLFQQPDFVMALIQQAVAVRILSTYQTDLETREQMRIRYDLLLKQAQSVAPEHPVVKSLTLLFDPDEKDWFRYEGILQDAVDYSPSCSICVRQLAEFYLNVGYYQRAEATITKHLDYFPLSVFMHSFLGILYSQQGNTEKTRHQANVIEALGSERGFDAMSVRVQTAMMEGDHDAFTEYTNKMLKHHPVFSQRLEVMKVLIDGDTEHAQELIAKMPFLDFNLAISSGMFDEALARATRNINAGQLRDLRLIHGWLLPDTYIEPKYTTNLLTFKNTPEVATLFTDIGLIDYWQTKGRWPDYCELDQYVKHRPVYCPE